jgi:hypothetical protein
LLWLFAKSRPNRDIRVRDSKSFASLYWIGAQ